MISASRAKAYFNRELSDTTIPLADRIEHAYRSFAHGENLELEVGGPISMIKVIPKNRMEVIKNDFSGRSPKSMKQFANDIRYDRIRVNYLRPGAKETFLKLIDKMAEMPSIIPLHH